MSVKQNMKERIAASNAPLLPPNIFGDSHSFVVFYGLRRFVLSVPSLNLGGK